MAPKPLEKYYLLKLLSDINSKERVSNDPISETLPKYTSQKST